MKIAPIDIAHKTFARKMMGLDGDEVMDFLRSVADEYESVVRERNSLRETLREKELTISDFRERDDLLKNTITTATKMSEKLQADADREARLIINDANQKAEMIVRDARDSLKRIYQEINDLKRLRMQFENNLKAIIQSHLTMLDQAQKIMPSPVIESQLGEVEMKETRKAEAGQGQAGPTSSEVTGSDSAQVIRSRISEAISKSL